MEKQGKWDLFRAGVSGCVMRIYAGRAMVSSSDTSGQERYLREVQLLDKHTSEVFPEEMRTYTKASRFTGTTIVSAKPPSTKEGSKADRRVCRKVGKKNGLNLPDASNKKEWLSKLLLKTSGLTEDKSKNCKVNQCLVAKGGVVHNSP
jgi:hypothetical protein